MILGISHLLNCVVKDNWAIISVLFRMLIIRDGKRLKLKRPSIKIVQKVICRMSITQEDYVDFSYLAQSECKNDPAIKFLWLRQ